MLRICHIGCILSHSEEDIVETEVIRTEGA